MKIAKSSTKLVDTECIGLEFLQRSLYKLCTQSPPTQCCF